MRCQSLLSEALSRYLKHSICMRFVSVVVAAFLAYQGVSMNDLPQVRDPQGFLAHLREEANEGDGQAWEALAQIYAHPELAQQFGLEVDQSRAVEHWRRGAELGHAGCQANFGSRLVRG